MLEIVEGNGLIAITETDVCRNKIPIIQPVRTDHLGHRIEQEQVSPWDNGQVDGAVGGSWRAPRIDADHLRRWVEPPPPL